jgi:hypothetical protein
MSMWFSQFLALLTSSKRVLGDSLSDYRQAIYIPSRLQEAPSRVLALRSVSPSGTLIECLLGLLPGFWLGSCLGLKACFIFAHTTCFNYLSFGGGLNIFPSPLLSLSVEPPLLSLMVEHPKGSLLVECANAP